MTIKQKFLQLIYPLFMKIARRKTTNDGIRLNKNNARPLESFYNLHAVKNDKSILDFSTLKGKKVLIVNTASNCGYTNQYDDLEKLYQQRKDTLEIIAFPSNDFKEQEQGSDEEIANFCKRNYGVSFMLMQKSHVAKGTEQNAVFQWLTDKNKNGWSNKMPSWNFAKYLIDEDGVLTHYFEPAVSPLSEEVLDAIQ